MPDSTRDSGGPPVPDVLPKGPLLTCPNGFGAVPESDRWVPWLVGGVVGVIVLAPYVTLGMRHSPALRVQAALVLLATTVLAAAGLSRRDWLQQIKSAPRRIKIGIAAYSGAAFLGALVGLTQGNDLAFLSGQLLSMGLLPLAAVAGLAFGRAPLWRPFAAAVVGSVTVAACINFACLGLGIGVGPSANRLFLEVTPGNTVAPTSAALITVNMALAAMAWERPFARWVSALAIVVTSILIVGSGIRSLWLVAAPSFVAVALSSRALRDLASGKKLLRVVSGIAAIASILLAFLVLWRPPSGLTRSLTARVRGEAALLTGRAAYLIPGISGRTFMDDPSIAYRTTETEFLVGAFAAARPITKLLGRGLGYSYLSKKLGLDDNGSPAAMHATNYVHNFYLFLPVKLGVVGSFAVLAALGLWTTWSVRAARGCHSEPQRTFVIAASAIWIAAAVWNAASPEFIDFHLAPLWGLLLAASVNAWGRSN